MLSTTRAWAPSIDWTNAVDPVAGRLRWAPADSEPCGAGRLVRERGRRPFVVPVVLVAAIVLPSHLHQPTDCPPADPPPDPRSVSPTNPNLTPAPEPRSSSRGPNESTHL